MKTIAIVQARMGSSRFPGKTMEILDGKLIIDRVLEKLVMSTKLDCIVVATTTDAIDSRLADHINDRKNLTPRVKRTSKQLYCTRGPVDDVLRRFYSTALAFADDDSIIVRITADCPLINSRIIDDVITLRESTGVLYASNVEPPTFPDGYDVEVFTMKALQLAFTYATLASDREHVTPWIRRNCTTANLRNQLGDFSHVRVTVDYRDDLQAMKQLATDVNIDEDIDCDVLVRMTCLDDRTHTRNEGYELSLKNDIESPVTKENK